MNDISRWTRYDDSEFPQYATVTIVGDSLLFSQAAVQRITTHGNPPAIRIYLDAFRNVAIKPCAPYEAGSPMCYSLSKGTATVTAKHAIQAAHIPDQYELYLHENEGMFELKPYPAPEV